MRLFARGGSSSCVAQREPRGGRRDRRRRLGDRSGNCRGRQRRVLGYYIKALATIGCQKLGEEPVTADGLGK